MIKEIRLSKELGVVQIELVPVSMQLSHVAIATAIKFSHGKRFFKARKLFVLPSAMSHYARHDFLGDSNSRSPLIILPMILGDLFNLYIIPMPEHLWKTFEWIVTDFCEERGVASHRS